MPKIDQTKIDWRLCFIVDSEALAGRDLLSLVREAVAGGATIIQLRGKTWTAREFLSAGFMIKESLQKAGIPLIINDRADIALACKATGVHLGQDDLPLEAARKILGPDFLIGISVNNPEEARKAEKEGADYLGAGPVFWTPSKADIRPPIGIDGLKTICAAVSIPVLAIGGITAETAAKAIAAGASGVAVIKAISAAANIEEAARNLRKAID